MIKKRHPTKSEIADLSPALATMNTPMTRIPEIAHPNDAPGSRRSDLFAGVDDLTWTGNHCFSCSPAYRRFVQELAYYRADEQYLTVDKCVERCRILSLLLTAALEA